MNAISTIVKEYLTKRIYFFSNTKRYFGKICSVSLAFNIVISLGCNGKVSKRKASSVYGEKEIKLMLLSRLRKRDAICGIPSDFSRPPFLFFYLLSELVVVKREKHYWYCNHRVSASRLDFFSHTIASVMWPHLELSSGNCLSLFTDRF